MNRLARIQQRIQQHGTDALLIFNDHNITYLSGFTGHAATALLLSDAAYLLTDYRYVEQAKAQCTEFKVICRDRINQSLAALIGEVCDNHAVNSLAFETDHISHGQWLQMRSEWQELSCDPVSRWVEDLRHVKDEEEIQSIRLAAHIADQALMELVSQIKPEVTERELAIELEYQMALLGSEAPSFPTIMLAAERSALPHGVPGDRALQPGDLLLIDFGAVINGYHSDMTRTFVLGKADEQQRAIYQTVLDAQQAALDVLRPGITTTELNEAAQAVLNRSPHAQYQGEGLGHGLGMDLHEQPFIGMGPEMTIEPGTVITIEPGIYIPGWGGVRIEDDVVLTDDGLQRLTEFPRRLMEL
jgi:Xaa-Pro aminopeptidase